MGPGLSTKDRILITVSAPQRGLGATRSELFEPVLTKAFEHAVAHLSPGPCRRGHRFVKEAVKRIKHFFGRQLLIRADAFDCRKIAAAGEYRKPLPQSPFFAGCQRIAPVECGS